MIAARRLTLLAIWLVAFGVVACSSAAEVTPPAGSPAQPSPTPAPTISDNSVTPIPTPTVAPSPTGTVKSPTATPSTGFLDNADCAVVTRQLLPTADVIIRDGTQSVALTAEIASTPSEQSQGLMCRETVPEGTGMLFVWDQERTGGFWMYNTYVPLDIIYFGAQDGSVAFRQMAPCPRDEGESDSAWNSRCGEESVPYRPGISYTTTLELPQGWLESLGFDTANPRSIVVSFTARD